MNSFASLQTITALPFPQPVEDLYSRIFDAILEQRLHAASRFTEESLAQMFGARRSDIRGVLTQLSHQQIIVLRTSHRPRVAAPDIEQTRQIFHARRLTETTLVKLACQQPRPQDLKRLHALDRQRAPMHSAWSGHSVIRRVSFAVGGNGGERTVGAFSRQPGAADVVGDCAV